MNAVPKVFTPEEFLQWRLERPGRWELVNGHPVQMMAGAKRRHDRVVVNLLIGLGNRLRGGPCEPCSADTAVRIPNGGVRQPDAMIDCGPTADDSMEASAPTVVFEVLSASNRLLDQVRKLEDYQRVPTLRAIVYVELSTPSLRVWSRASEADAWTAADATGLEGTLTLPAVGVDLPLSEIYEGLTFSDDAA